MHATHPLSRFHQWLLASTEPPCPSRAIVLHGGCAEQIDPTVREIADYLNEYDGEGAGRWLAATSGLVRRISESSDARRLLGMLELDSEESSCEIRKTLTALGRRGHVVFYSDATREKPLDLPEAFQAGIGSADCSRGKCHLILDPDLVQARNLAHMVSDVFLDWHHGIFQAASAAATKNASTSAIHDQTGFPDVASF